MRTYARSRPIAGVYSLSEFDKRLRLICLLMETEAVGCTYEDAEVLANMRRSCRTLVEHSAVVKWLMSV
jgi:hypothetical protein